MLSVVIVTISCSLLLYLLIDSCLSLVNQYQRHIGYKIALFTALNLTNFFIFKGKGKIYDFVHAAFISYLHNVRDTRFVIQKKLEFIKLHWWTVAIFFLLFLITFCFAVGVVVGSIKEKEFGTTTELCVSSFFILSLIIGLICTQKINIITVLLCLIIIPIIIKFNKYGLNSYSDICATGWIFFDLFFLWIYFYPDSILLHSAGALAYLIGAIIGLVIKPFFETSGGYGVGYSEEHESTYDRVMRKTGNMIEDDFGRKGYIRNGYVEDEFGFKTHKIEEDGYGYIKDTEGHIYFKDY